MLVNPEGIQLVVPNILPSLLPEPPVVCRARMALCKANVLQGDDVACALKYLQDENGHHHVIGHEGVLTRCEDEVRHGFRIWLW